MKTSSILLGALLPAAAIAQIEQNETFITGLFQTLQNSGVTSLSDVLTQINSSEVGQGLLANISSGSPYLLFAPNNDALSSAPENITGDAGLLTDTIGYHIVPGNFSSSIPTYPNITIGRTLLTDPRFVRLEGGNKAQVAAWAEREDGRTHVLNQRNDSTVVDVTSFENVTVYIIDHLLIIPENFSSTIPTNNEGLTAIETILQTVQTPVFNTSTNETANVTLFQALDVDWHGFTFFAPSNGAVANASSSLESLAGNETAIQAVLYNHIINGTTLYSPLLANQNFTSTAGATLAFTINATGQYVTSANTTARILQPDVLLPNGVVHVIDSVLLNTEEDPEAASSAIASATSVATESPTETEPVGFSQTVSLDATATGGADSTDATGESSGAFVVPGRNALVGLSVSALAVLVGALVTLA
ncbi:unnamed protein product [Somion occarium]|uniref:FAS1 domain-containing protein n=1 Tax=Somion occarium TaxID=3059160 RepID=A0ABP1CNI3_9APHY